MRLRSVSRVLLVATMSGLFLSACGSGGDDSSSGGSTAGDNLVPAADDVLRPSDDGGIPPIISNDGSSLTGVFEDSEVVGLGYATSSGSTGTTNVAGEFLYGAGEEVTFSVGPLELGTAVGKPRMNPFDLTGYDLPTGDFHLVDLETDIENFERGNITEFTHGLNELIFLQSLDENNNPRDGIVILPAVTTYITNNPGVCTLTFNQNADDFILEFTTCFNSLVNSAVLDRDAGAEPVLAARALRHFVNVVTAVSP